MVYRVTALNQMKTLEDISGCRALFEDAPSGDLPLLVKHLRLLETRSAPVIRFHAFSGSADNARFRS
jgi:hypothetical protein